MMTDSGCFCRDTSYQTLPVLEPRAPWTYKRIKSQGCNLRYKSKPTTEPISMKLYKEMAYIPCGWHMPVSLLISIFDLKITVILATILHVKCDKEFCNNCCYKVQKERTGKYWLHAAEYRPMALSPVFKVITIIGREVSVLYLRGLHGKSFPDGKQLLRYMHHGTFTSYTVLTI